MPNIIDMDGENGVREFAQGLTAISDVIAKATCDRKKAAPSGFLKACDDAAIVATREMGVSEEMMKLREDSPFRLTFLHKSGVIAPLFISGPPEDPRRAVQCAGLLKAFIKVNNVSAYSLSTEMWMATGDSFEELKGNVRDRPDRVEIVAVKALARSQPGRAAILLALTERKRDGSFDKLSPDLMSRLMPGAAGKIVGGFDISPMFQNMFDVPVDKPTVH